MQKGGILIISKDDANIYNKLQIALTQGKPVLWYETPTECYYIDTISGGEITTEIVDDEEVTTYGDIILTKGGKTITITSANAVSESGNIIANRIEDIVDSAGNKRFIEGEATTPTITGINISYNKWSLSGTHLMFVIAGSIDTGTIISSATRLATYNLPKYINDKINPIVSNDIDKKNVAIYGSDYTTQTLGTTLIKYTTEIGINLSALTLTATRNFRIQFDLLIDADYSE